MTATPLARGGEALRRLSHIIGAFDERFGSTEWSDKDRRHRLITEGIPAKVAADAAYQNAQAQSDNEKTRIEYDLALPRVMNGLLEDDTDLFKQFVDKAVFRRFLANEGLGLTYKPKETA
ncbi:MAG: hypothetical protein ACYC5O_01445 [Anaerolineae bacterium]